MGQSNLNVILLNHTQDPEALIAHAAKLCYSPSSVEELKEKIKKPILQSRFLWSLIEQLER